MILFDTSVLIELEAKNKKTLDQLKVIAESYPGSPAISSLSYFEFIFGALSISSKKFSQAIEFLSEYDCLTFSKTTAVYAAKLRNHLKNKGVGVPLADLLIASIAKEYGATLITRDKFFSQIKEIKTIVI